ncbi:MAG TPA: branched-chain amino acid ABC transporter substrate-binding protein [Chloroflexota bacterium]|nr:branched-chain amino acid ABC transporter substrate-binding protein [Chloroflexota bacterium]
MRGALWPSLPLAAGTALLIALAACAPQATAPGAAPAQPTSPVSPSSAGGNTVKIFSSLPMTGSALGQTQTIVNAIRMAVDERGGKAGNLTVIYEALDDATPAKGAWDEGKEAENANRAVNDPEVVAYIGTFNSGAAKVAIPILNRANLVMVSPANTYPGLTKPGKGEPGEPDIYYPTGVRNYARVVPADDLQGAVGAKWAKELGAQRVYVLDDSELYGRGLATVFHQEAKRRGLQVFPPDRPDSIDPKASDYRSLALRVRQTNPDLVYYGGITQNNAGKLWQDLRAALGPNVKLMGPDGIFEQAFLDAAGEAAIGTYLTFGGVPVKNYTGKAADWARRYRERFRSEPEVYAIYGYEAANVILDAIERVGRRDRVAIRDAVMSTKDYDGVLGRWSFDANGDTTLTTMSGSQVKGLKMDQVEFVTMLTLD